MNPFTSSIDRKGYLVWNIALSLLYYAIRFSINSATILLVYGIASVVLAILVVVRRLQNTGLNMLLLLALLLPFANIILLIALFFVPPNASTANSSGTGASRGFKITMGIIISLFLVLCAAVAIGLTH